MPQLQTRKYLLPTGFSKSHFLYGLEHAITAVGPVVICEGVTDVWRVGPNGVALTGKTMSHAQEQLILGRFRGRRILVALDEDAVVEAGEIVQRLRTAWKAANDPGEVEFLSLPDGRQDIGECSAKEIEELLGSMDSAVIKPWKYPPLASGLAGSAVRVGPHLLKG